MATKYMLCSFKTCPWVQRAAIVLRAKNVSYDITYIDRDKRPEWFLKVSPHSKVPVLVIDGKDALFESNAIAGTAWPVRWRPRAYALRKLRRKNASTARLCVA